MSLISVGNQQKHIARGCVEAVLCGPSYAFGATAEAVNQDMLDLAELRRAYSGL